MLNRVSEMVNGWADRKPILEATEADAHSAEKGSPTSQYDIVGCCFMKAISARESKLIQSSVLGQ